MKIVILTVNQIYSNKILKDLINEFGTNIILIGESDVLLQNRTLPDALKRYIKISGPYYVIVQGIKLAIFKVLSFFSHFINNTDNKFYNYKLLAERKNIPIDKIKNVNDSDFINYLKRKKVDLIISVFFNQILKSEVITVPFKGVINIHPSYLPDYKGTGPIFWSLVNKERNVGLSVHYIDEGIDTGRILARARILVNREDTEDSLYWQSVKLGGPLLINVVKLIEKGNQKFVKNKGGRTFRIPTKAAVAEFKKNKRSFFNLKNYVFDR